MSQSAVLYRLQTLESEATTSQKRLDEINELLGQDEEVRAAQTAHDEAEATLRANRADVRDLEMEIASLETKMKTTEERLYSGREGNPRELQSMQEEVESLRRRVGRLEDELLKAMLTVDESEAATKQTRGYLQTITQQRSVELSALGGEKLQLEARMEELTEEIRQAREQLSPEHLQLYDNVKKRRGIAVIQTTDGVCGACGVAPTSSQLQRVRHGEVELCPTCGRILYFRT